MFHCPKCGKKKPRTLHHVYPRRFFSMKDKENRETVPLCRSCHDEIEALINAEEVLEGGQLQRMRYKGIVRSFLS